MFGASLGMGILYAGNGAAARQAGKTRQVAVHRQTNHSHCEEGQPPRTDKPASLAYVRVCTVPGTWYTGFDIELVELVIYRLLKISEDCHTCEQQQVQGQSKVCNDDDGG